MGVQDEITKYFLQGYTPQQIMDMGYKKSTVYKVYKTLKTYVTDTPSPNWEINNIKLKPPKQRYLPGENISLSFNFRNNSENDIYLYRIGIWTEWLKPNEWYMQEVRDIIKPNQKRFFSFSIPIPDDISLGEYEIRFGIQAQYLPVIDYRNQSLQVEWSEPFLLHVKYPLSGIKIFISHSTKDLSIVRQLEHYLDVYGIEAIIAEDIRTPGSDLDEKMMRLINECNIFLAILTENSIASKWVLKEVNYAYQIKKPLILLKEEKVKITSNIEWTEFSKDGPIDIIFNKIIEAIKEKPINKQISSAIALGIMAFIVGLFFGGMLKR